MSENLSSENTATDIDGNVYDSIAIGAQVWMTENLRVTKYSNGEPISRFDIDNWLDLETGELFKSEKGDYCYYENNEKINLNNGYLYNWYAVNDPRQLAPFGWHVPSLSDWKLLFNFLGGELNVGDKIKITGINNWGTRKIGSDNSSGFSALPSGFRSLDGSFKGMNYYSYWWTSTSVDPLRSWFCYLSYGIKYATFRNDLNNYGFSVRCLRDNYG